MKILVQDNKITIEKNDKNVDFDYISFINELYSKEEIEEVIFDETISKEEKEQIEKMIQDIQGVVSNFNN